MPPEVPWWKQNELESTIGLVVLRMEASPSIWLSQLWSPLPSVKLT